MDLTPRLTAALADRYRIERELGAGGMATVWLAHDLKHDRDVAIKVLHPDLGAALGGERFLSEIRTTARLQHPHILPLLDSGEADGLLYYVMPVVTGETLRARLEREQQLPINDAVRVTREIASALDYAHRQGVVHRDIKPENILLHDGQAIVADFGIALAVQQAGGQRMTQTGLSLGTPQYMSPEQAMGEKSIDARADVYALGAVAYEMLTGDAPFTGSTVQAIVAKVLSADPERPSMIRKTIPPHVEGAVLTALAKLPADRFASAAEFATALGNQQYTATTSVSPAMAGVGAGSRRTTMVLGAVAVVAIGAAVSGWMRKPAEAPSLKVSLALPDSQAFAPQTRVVNLAISHDGTQIAYVGVGTKPGTTRIWLRRLSEFSARPLAGTEGAMNPAFSPDDRQIAFISGGPKGLRKLSLSGGAPELLTDSLVDEGGVSWSTDGYIYYDGHLPGDGLARIRAAGGRAEAVTMPTKEYSFHTNPTVLPDGRGVLFNSVRAGGTYEIALFDAKTKATRTLLSGGFSPRYVKSGHLLFTNASGTLMAAPFDLQKLELRGEPISVLPRVAYRTLGRTDVAISDEGVAVYASNDEGVERTFFWMDRAGRLTLIDSSLHFILAGTAALSPDESAIAFATGTVGTPRRIWLKRLPNGPVIRLADGGTSPAWTPDGKSVLFLSSDGINEVPADGSRLPRLVVSRGTRSFGNSLTVSPDGRHVVLSSASDLVQAELGKDSTYQPLYEAGGTQTRPSFSPDGKWIAFMSDEGGRPEYYARPWPDFNRTRYQISNGGAEILNWSHDGKSLYLRTSALELIEMPVTLGTALQIGTPQVILPSMHPTLVNSSSLNVTRNGRFLVQANANVTTRAHADELLLITNLFADLRAKPTGVTP